DILIASRIVGGIGVGMASVVSPMLIAELAPADKRGRMIAYYQLAITVGILLAYFSNALFVSWGTSHGSVELWRPMFLAMIVPSVVFLLLLIRIPESPRWLVKMHRGAEALVVLQRIRPAEVAASEHVEMHRAAVKAVEQKRSVWSSAIRLPLLI